MIRAIVWKEFREQGLIGLTLMALGTGILVAAATFADPPTPGAGPADIIRYMGAGQLAALLLAVTAGTVCGGGLFAAEREAGTMGFLESLPVSRWELWRAKLAAGSALAVVQIGLVIGVAVGLGLIESGRWAAAIFADALLAFAWGVFGSTVARTTLGSVGVAVPAASAAALVFLVPVMLLFQHPRTNMPRAEGSLIFLALMVVTPVAGSALRFTRPDRDRAAHDPTPDRPVLDTDETHRPPPRGGRGVGLKALGWLAARQLARPGLVVSGLAVPFGLVLLAPAVQPVLAWPVLALLAGVLAGVTAFADEQSHGTARFWGERRLPTGRMWGVKVAAHAVFALWLGLLLVLPSGVRAELAPGRDVPGENALSAAFRTLLFDYPHLGPQGWKYLLVPLGYGFAAGCLCGMLFRKTVVAAGVAGMVGGTAAALWLPSLLAGGVSNWQVWLPPVLILATARVLARPWAADRLATRGPLATLGGGAVVVLLVMAAGIGYRVVEVPDNPAGDDDTRYVTGLVPIDANDSGRQFRTATEQFARAAGATPPSPDRGPARRSPAEERLGSVLLTGWRADDEWIAEWLDDLYRPTPDREEPWYAMAADAARQPTGMFEHPQRSGTVAGAVTLANGRRMGVVIVVHGLARQAAGHPERFPADLRTALALGRSLRSGSVIPALVYGTDVARLALFGTERWLAGLDDARPKLIGEALRAVLEDDRTALTRVMPDGRVLPPAVLDREAGPLDLTPHFLAQRYVTRELLKAPGVWLPNLITPAGGDKEVMAPVGDLVGLAWSVPWERERTRRLLGLGFEAGAGARERALVRGRPGAQLLTAVTKPPTDLEESDRQLRVHRRAVAVMLAVRLFQAGHRGKSPVNLDELVAAGYLPVVPTDPYDDKPLKYRVSGGEELSPPRRQAQPGPVVMMGPDTTSAGPPPVKVLRGQGVIWSVGPDRQDDGGQNLPATPGGPARYDDIVFLAPLPPDEK